MKTNPSLPPDSIPHSAASPALAHALEKNAAGRSAQAGRIPLWLKVAYTAFLAVLIPVYLTQYGPTNFLYFCDVALLLMAWGLWRESSLAVSLAAVGILLPQVLWCVDFAVELSGGHFTRMTSYMLDSSRSLFLRGLSLFHGWLPFLVVYAVKKLGYDRRALPWWTGIAVVLCLIAFFFLPPAGAVLENPAIPRNVNYVFGLDDAAPQTRFPAGVYLVGWIAALIGIVYVPTHLLLRKIMPDAGVEK
ncbi:MAG: hypothetical protein JWL81_3293 [Verrucomicrobiales bacterium]|nr:hypothetical protein [Verrucomicrobiales bacterium]